MSRPFRSRSAAAVRSAQMPNMTPMVDVVMVILIFFMATAAIMGPEWILKTALPGAKVRTQVAPDKLVPLRLVVTPSGVTVISGTGEARRETPTTIEELPKVLAGLASQYGAENLAASFDASDAVAYDAVVRAHEACMRAGITRVGVLPPP